MKYFINTLLYKIASLVERTQKEQWKQDYERYKEQVAKGKNYYEILGISPNADEKEIKEAYKKLVLIYHPDKVPPEKKKEAEEYFKKINEAYETLIDPEKRELYNEVLKQFREEKEEIRYSDIYYAIKEPGFFKFLRKNIIPIQYAGSIIWGPIAGALWHYTTKKIKLNPFSFFSLFYSFNVAPELLSSVSAQFLFKSKEELEKYQKDFYTHLGIRIGINSILSYLTKKLLDKKSRKHKVRKNIKFADSRIPEYLISGLTGVSAGIVHHWASKGGINPIIRIPLWLSLNVFPEIMSSINNYVKKVQDVIFAYNIQRIIREGLFNFRHRKGEVFDPHAELTELYKETEEKIKQIKKDELKHFVGRTLLSSLISFVTERILNSLEKNITSKKVKQKSIKFKNKKSL